MDSKMEVNKFLNVECMEYMKQMQNKSAEIFYALSLMKEPLI